MVYTLSYHHPIKLDICDSCDRAFTLWLGHPPLHPGTTIEAIAEGRASGDHIPNRKIAKQFLKNEEKLNEST